MDTNNFRPIIKDKSFIIICNKYVSSLVSSLLVIGRPLAICWRIFFIVIYSIKLMLVSRRITHIRQKVFKFMPPITYCYSSTPIVFIVGSFFIIASLLHGGPFFIYCALASCFCVSMSNVMGRVTASLSHKLISEASTGFACFTCKPTIYYNTFSTTVAFTKKSCIFTKFFNSGRYYSPASKALTSKINCFSHGSIVF